MSTGRKLPESASDDANLSYGPWSDGKWLVAHALTEFPKRCMACNTPINSLKEISVRHPTRIHTRGALGAVVAVAWLATADRITVRYGTCPKHALRGSCIVWGTILGLVAVASGIAGLLLSLDNNGRVSVMMILAFLVCFACLAGTIFAATFQPQIRKARGSLVWLSGFGQSFLAALPSVEEADERLLE